MRGSLWVALTAECFDDIMKLTTPRVERCLKVFCPDEMYFHTLIAATRHASDNAAGGSLSRIRVLIRPAWSPTSTSSTIHSTSSSPSTTSR